MVGLHSVHCCLGASVRYGRYAGTVPSDSVGTGICALGIFVAIWSRKTLGVEWSQDIELKQGHKLVKRGPYTFVRHPIYTGHLLIGLP